MKAILILLFFFLAFGLSNISSQGFVKHILNDTTIVTDNGYMKRITPYRDGKKYGQEVLILSSGDTLEIVHYKDDKYDGKAVAFYPGHKVGTVRYFKEDYKVGEWLHFDTLGNVKTKTTFDKPFKQNEPRWSGKEIFYEKNKPVFTQVWTEGRRSSVIVHNADTYKQFQLNDKTLGNKLFNEECASCHLIKQDLIGPALIKSVDLRKEEWLISFIRNGDALHQSGDTATRKLYEKYNNIKHPDFTYLTKDDIKSIISYIRQTNNYR